MRNQQGFERGYGKTKLAKSVPTFVNAARNRLLCICGEWHALLNIGPITGSRASS